MFEVGKVYRVSFLDHESESSVLEADIELNKSCEVTIYGKFLKEFKDYYVFASWVCPEGSDIYRVIKSCVVDYKEVVE